MAEFEAALTAFKDAISESPGMWQALDGRTIALRTGDGWENLGTRVYLDPRPPEKVTRFPDLPVTENLKALQWIHPAQSITELLDGLAEGTLRLCGEPILIRETARTPDLERTPYRLQFGYSELSSRYARHYIHWSAHYLIGYGSTTHALIRTSSLTPDEVDATLRASSVPYDGLSDLEIFFLGMPTPTSSNTAVGLEIFAPLQVRFDRDTSRFLDGQVTVHAVAASREHLEAASVGVFGIGRGDLPIQRMGLPDTPTEEDGSWHCFFTTKLEEARWAKIFLTVAGRPADKLLLRDPAGLTSNPRLLSYATIDPDAERFQEWLFPDDKSNSVQFEHAVSRLFTFLGFQVDTFAAQRRLADGVDLLAHDPNNPRLLTIECTTSSLDTQGKLGKLVARSRGLQLQIAPIEVTPVIVSALRQDQLSEPERQKAGEDGVAVVANEDLAELLDAASESRSIDSVFALIRALVPEIK